MSHSDNLHYGILSNPQQNKQPAAIARLYDEKPKAMKATQHISNVFWQI
ncbi:hypothetical protein [Acinetobacter towneri]|nr:hypothetical protein [Acinetobacter towneri]WOE28127.1 hypothetical protein QSG83_12075 [Acinetobacter towneri]